MDDSHSILSHKNHIVKRGEYNMPKLKRRADGRYQKSIVDSRTGKKVFFYGKTEKELNQKILAYTGEQEKGASFQDVADSWWDKAQDSLAIQSITTYKPALKRLCEFFKNKSIIEIKPMEISYFLSTLANQGYAQKTILNHKLVCNLIFTYALTQNYLEINPCSSVIIPKALPKKKRAAASSSDEEIIKNSHDVWLFPYIAIMTGMRKGEILALQWKDIDFNNNLIKVSKSVCHDGDIPKIKETKTEAGIRVVPLLKPLKEVLSNVKNKKPDNFIISIDEGKTPLRKKRYITIYNKFKEKTGISCTAHQLRHSFATVAFEAGVPVKSVQEILGHKQISTTMDIYTDFRKKSLDSAAELLNDKFKM